MKNEQDQQNKIDEMKIIREVNIQAESFYEEAKNLGNRAAVAFGQQHRAQISGLENIAESALKTSDVFDYIKRQTARREYWRQDNLGKDLIQALEGDLATSQKRISDGLKISEKTDAGRQERRRIHLLLIRQFVRQMAVHYEFLVSFGTGERRNGSH